MDACLRRSPDFFPPSSTSTTSSSPLASPVCATLSSYAIDA